MTVMHFIRLLPWYDEWEERQRDRRTEEARRSAIASRIKGEQLMARVAHTAEAYREAAKGMRRLR